MKIVNMVLSQKIPLNKPLSIFDMDKIINKSPLGWQCVNERYCPILVTKFTRENKSVSVSIWSTGYTQITGGVKSIRDGQKVYDFVIKDLKKVVPNLGEK